MTKLKPTYAIAAAALMFSAPSISSAGDLVVDSAVEVVAITAPAELGDTPVMATPNSRTRFTVSVGYGAFSEADETPLRLHPALVEDIDLKLNF